MTFYEELALDKQASTQEIQAKLNDLGRLWQKRVNAPDIKKRQEAELILAQIVDAKAAFKDEESRRQYDTTLSHQIDIEMLIGDDHKEGNQELLDLIEQMGSLMKARKTAEALLVAKEAIYKYPKSFVSRINACQCLYILKRFDEALSILKEVDCWILYDGERLILNKYILSILFVEYKDIKASEQYFETALPLADVIQDDQRCSEAILTWAVKYYVDKGNYDESIRRFDQLSSRVNQVDPTVYFWILEAIKLKCESLYQKNQKGEFIVTNLDQIDEIKKLLLKASALKEAKPDYDGKWIDARLNYLNLAVKEKDKSMLNIAYVALIIFGILFLRRVFYGVIFNLQTGLLLAANFYIVKYIMSDKEPLYIKNRKSIG